MKECKCTFAQKMVGDGCSICNPQLMIEMLQEQIQELVATIEAQEIIIKDKSAIMEAMAQPKTCDGCNLADILGDKRVYCRALEKLLNPDFTCAWFEAKVQQ